MLKKIQQEIQKNMESLLKLKKSEVIKIGSTADYLQGKVDAYQEDIELIEEYLKIFNKEEE